MLTKYYYYYYYYYSLLRVFHTSVSRWFFTEVWVTASLLESPVFLAFWPISTMLLFGWFPLVFLFPSSPIPVQIIWWLCRAHQLQLVSPSLSVLLVPKQGLSIYLFSLSFTFALRSTGIAKSTIRHVLFFFCWQSQVLVSLSTWTHTLASKLSLLRRIIETI